MEHKTFDDWRRAANNSKTTFITHVRDLWYCAHASQLDYAKAILTLKEIQRLLNSERKCSAKLRRELDFEQGYSVEDKEDSALSLLTRVKYLEAKDRDREAARGTEPPENSRQTQVIESCPRCGQEINATTPVDSRQNFPFCGQGC